MIILFFFTERRKRSSLWLHKPKRSKLAAENTDGILLTPETKNRPTEIRSTQLKRAPKKTCQKRKSIGKRKLFIPSSSEKVTEEIIEIIPGVLSKLGRRGLLTDFCNLLRLIHEDKFPLNNISFLLLLEVVRWYSLTNTSQMFYSSETMKFWKVLFRLFHGKALRFMSV